MSTAALLEHLDTDTLLELSDALGLALPADAPKEGIVRTLADSDAANLSAVLAALSRDALKSLCKELGVDVKGTGKAPYVNALAERFRVVDEVGTRSVTLEVHPRQPRLAWLGMDQREAVTAVPTQVVEIVRPGRARALETEKAEPRALLDVNVREVGARRGEEEVPNRLIWTNDNLVALQTLLNERDSKTRDYRYRGKVDLVYIDPPFMVNSDFRADNAITIPLDEDAHIEATKEPSLVETLAYRDTWRNGLDSFLIMLRRRLELLKDLLSPTGSIYVHLDWHAVHYVKVLMDEVFGYENFQSEIVWKRTSARSDSEGFNHVHDTILGYSLGPGAWWQQVLGPLSAEYIRSHYGQIDPSNGRRFTLDNLTSPSPRPNMMYELKGHKPPANGWRYDEEVMAELVAQGLIHFPERGGRPRFKRYLDDDGTPIQSVWNDISPVNSQAADRLNYPTQKPVALIERIISASCRPGGLVLDCFMGSGTTLEAAERLGRRWIGIDAGKYATHLARKRLILLHGTPKAPPRARYDYVECEHCGNIERKEKKTRSQDRYEVKPFTMENMGVYQRAESWQDFQTSRTRYRDEMVRVFGGEPTDTHELLHGMKGKAWIHIGPLDGAISELQVWTIAHVVATTELQEIYVLTADFDSLGGSTTREDIRSKLGITVKVNVIPKTAIDEVRFRIEAQAKGGGTLIESMSIPAFYAPLSIRLVTKVDGRKVTVTLARCEVDIESFISSQKPLLSDAKNAKTPAAKKRVADEQKKWAERERFLSEWLQKSTSWQHFVDFWSIDGRYGARVGDDGKAIFQTEWQSFRERGAKKGEALTFSAELRYDAPGSYRIAARVTDVFGNDGIATVDVTVK
jgi:DNA modification methylase